MAGYEELYTEPDSNDLRTIFKPFAYNRFIDRLSRDPRILHPVMQLLGSQLYIMQSRIARWHRPASCIPPTIAWPRTTSAFGVVVYMRITSQSRDSQINKRSDLRIGLPPLEMNNADRKWSGFVVTQYPLQRAIYKFLSNLIGHQTGYAEPCTGR